MHEVKYTIQYCTYSQLQWWKWLTFNKFFFRFYRAIYTQIIHRFNALMEDTVYIYMSWFPCTLIMYHYLSIATKLTFPFVPHSRIQLLFAYVDIFWYLCVLVFVHYGLSPWLMYVPTILHQNWLLIRSCLQIRSSFWLTEFLIV